LRIKFVDGLVGYHNFGRFQNKVSDTLHLFVQAVHESGYQA